MKQLIQTITKSFLFLILVLVISTGCQQTNEETASAFDKEKAESFVDSLNTKFEEQLRSGDSAALASHYSSDAELMFPNSETMKGKDIISGWGGVIRSGARDFTFTTVDLIGDENFMIETGTSELRDQNKNTIDRGKYLVVYKKENGEWKIYRDISNTNMPAGK